MRPSLESALLWTPRVLTLLFAVFLGLFALDVFGEGLGFWRTIAAFLIHLVPAGIVLLVLAVAWRWRVVGALFFFALGVWYLTMALGRLHWSASVVIAGPLFLIGTLFLIDAAYGAGRRAATLPGPGRPAG